MDIQAIIDTAFDNASEATDTYLRSSNGWYPCGFSGVRIKPARGKLISYLKDNRIGHRDEYEGGWLIWNPSMNGTQSMDAKIAGSEAFVKTIRKHFPKYRFSVYSRLD